MSSTGEQAAAAPAPEEAAHEAPVAEETTDEAPAKKARPEGDAAGSAAAAETDTGGHIPAAAAAAEAAKAGAKDGDASDEEGEGGAGGADGDGEGGEVKVKNPAGKKRKIAMFLAYVGGGYQGMQRNPGAVTIEDALELAIVKAGGISAENAGRARQMLPASSSTRALNPRFLS